MHTNHAPQVPLQHDVGWEAHQQYSGHVGDAVTTRAPDTRHHSTSTIPWPMNPVETSNAPTVYEPPQTMSREWAVAEAPPDHELYARQPVPVDQTTTHLLAQHRPPPKKKAAKVPSSFVERQEKLKVSKRKGPLQERQREKTHTMRKTKRICVRCRFYKSGVCMSNMTQCKTNECSVTKEIRVKSVRRSQATPDPFASPVTGSISKTLVLYVVVSHCNICCLFASHN